MKHHGSRYWFINFLSRMSLFIFLYVLVVLMLFIMGNFQDFLDSTLENLLYIIESAALVGGITIIFLLAATLLFALMGREFSLFLWINSAIGLFVLVIILFFVKFLAAWLHG